LHATLTDVIPDRWPSVEQHDSVSSRQERRLVNAVGHELMAFLPTFDVAAFRTEPDITSAAAAFGEGPKPHMSFVDVRLAKRQLSIVRANCVARRDQGASAHSRARTRRRAVVERDYRHHVTGIAFAPQSPAAGRLAITRIVIVP